MENQLCVMDVMIIVIVIGLKFKITFIFILKRFHRLTISKFLQCYSASVAKFSNHTLNTGSISFYNLLFM